MSDLTHLTLTSGHGGLEANKHEHKKLHAGRGAVGKTTVIGLRERGGRTVAHPVAALDANALQGAIHQHVEYGATIHTDEASAYADLGTLFYRHETVNHGAGEYARPSGVSVRGSQVCNSQKCAVR